MVDVDATTRPRPRRPRLDEGVRLWIRHAEGLLRDIERLGAPTPELLGPLVAELGAHVAATVAGEDAVETLHSACTVLRAAGWVSDVVLADLALWAIQGPPSVYAARAAGAVPSLEELRQGDPFGLFTPRDVA